MLKQPSLLRHSACFLTFPYVVSKIVADISKNLHRIHILWKNITKVTRTYWNDVRNVSLGKHVKEKKSHTQMQTISASSKISDLARHVQQHISQMVQEPKLLNVSKRQN